MCNKHSRETIEGVPDLASACPSCGHGGQGRAIVVRGYRYATCSRCGSGWLDPLPSLEAAYGESYFLHSREGGYQDYCGDEPIHRRNARERLVRIEGPPGRILDVGCAHGFFLDEARQRGWQTSGVEISSYAAPIARSRGHEVFETLDAAVEEGPGRFDVVSFFQVLEHLPDPETALRSAATLLRPGGLLIVETWDLSSRTARLSGRRWQQIYPPTVIHLFTRAGLLDLAGRTGFREVRIGRTTKLVSAGTVLGQIGSRLARMGGPLLRLARSPWIASRALRYPGDDLVTLVAWKTPALGP
jgi:SAM-dependent methyltransferase